MDVRFLPAAILFSYLHGIINIYALFTLTATHWGSQELEQLEMAREFAGEEWNTRFPEAIKDEVDEPKIEKLATVGDGETGAAMVVS